ncbi:hypothetical protein [Virgibacillus halodenitrificans]|uniref:hypothetical protein n=1 Tax=Virgibacillus halodenitrificans TaxID=1482 RepID=UPI0007616C68
MKKEKEIKVQLVSVCQCTCGSRLGLYDDPIPDWFIELKQQEKKEREKQRLNRSTPVDPFVEAKELEKLLRKYH